MNMAVSVEVRGTVESRVFRKNFAYLKDGLKEELDAFILLLYQKDLITEGSRDKALLRTTDKSQRTVGLLVAVECQVKTNQTAFSTFIGVLKSVPPLKHLAEKLRGDYDHMLNPPLDSYRAETPSELTEQQLHAPHEADSDPADWPQASRDGAIAGPPPPATVRLSDNGSVPSDSAQPETKPSAHTSVQFFLSPTPETSQNSSSSIVGAPQPPPIVDDMQCMRPPRHSMSDPSSVGTQLASITQPEFRRELKSILYNLEEFVVTSYGQKEQEVEEQSAEVAQTKIQVQITSKELVDLAIQLDEAEKRCKGYEAEISGYQEELELVESQHEKEKALLENKLSLKIEDLESTTSAVRHLGKCCNELELKLETERVEHKQELRNAEEEVVSLKLENVSLHEEKTSLCAELKQKEVEMKQKEVEMKQKDAEARQREAEISSLRQELDKINSGFSKKKAEIQKKILKKESISRSRINSATQQCLDIKAQMKQSVSQLDVFTDSQDPKLKKLIHDIQHLFSVYDKQKRSVSWPSGLCKLQLL